MLMHVAGPPVKVDGKMILHPILLGFPSPSRLHPTSPGSNQLVVLFAHTLETVIAQSQFCNRHQPSIVEKAV